MSKPRSKRHEPPPRDVRPHWEERGYRPEIAALPPRPNEDPKGELAYQRAFAEAAKSDPPRLPNPQKYTNSESAMQFMRKRDPELISSRGFKRPGDEQSTSQQSLRRLRDPDRSPFLSTVKQDTDISPSTQFMPTPRLAPPTSAQFSMPRASDRSPTATTQLPTATPQQSFAAPRLSVMEPYCGPTGPVNKLR